MASDTKDAWNEFAPFYQTAVGSYTDDVHYGFDIPTENELHLIGDVKGKRVLDLGCGGGQNAVTMAKQGARVIGIDYSAEQLRFAKKLAEEEELKLELREGDMYDLAFLPADNIDVVVSTLAFDFIDDLARLCRAIHRVLTEGGLLVFSMRHPINNLVNHGKDADPFHIQRSYWTTDAIREPETGSTILTGYQHTFSDMFHSLTRSGFVVDNIVEPEGITNAPKSLDWRTSYTRIPSTLIVRAHNVGS